MHERKQYFNWLIRNPSVTMEKAMVVLLVLACSYLMMFTVVLAATVAVINCFYCMLGAGKEWKFCLAAW